MFAICMAVAAGSLAEHPPLSVPLGLAGGQQQDPGLVAAKQRVAAALAAAQGVDDPVDEVEARKQATVDTCASQRNELAMFNAMYLKEITKPSPDAEWAGKLQAVRQRLVEKIGKHKDMLDKYPELEARIEARQKELRAKGE